jgi:hypothetical protein
MIRAGNNQPGAFMRFIRWGVAAAVAALFASAVALPSAAFGASSEPPYEVTFDSTMVNHFAGINNGPSGSETTEIQATIPLAASGSAYSGSAEAKYAQASGTITETCTSGDTTGTTEEIEQSGNPTNFQATYTPGSSGSGGSLQLNIGPFSGGLAETFQDIPGCGGLTVGNTTPRFLADFVANHESQLLALADPGDMVFGFTMTPGGSLGGSTSYAGTYNFTGGATNENLTYSETTAISVIADNCVVPNLVGQTEAAAESALAAASCTVGAITTQAGSGTPGTVLSSSPGAGTKLDQGAAVALVISTAAAPKCTVPAVKGDKLAAAESKIKKAGCAVGKITKKKSAKKKKGHVISQSPAAGASKPAGTKVALTVGK